MTTIRHCSIPEFVRGAFNQAVAPGIARPLHATYRQVWVFDFEGTERFSFVTPLGLNPRL